MKKILPVLILFVLVFTGIASAEAPYQINLKIDDGVNPYQTSVIVKTGDQVAIKLGETDVRLEIQEKQADGLNFKFDPALQVNDEKHGIVDVNYFFLPAGIENIYTEPGKTSPTLTISWTELTLPEQYDALIRDVNAVLNGELIERDDFSMIFRMLARTEYAKNAGFYVTDLDADGTPELLLGENQPQSTNTVFYDLYTIKDGELVHVFDGWDRSRYYLVNNGGIANEGSSSAFESYTAFYYYTNGELKLMQSIIYNANANPNNPWRISNTSVFDINDDDQLIDETEARYLLAQYPYIQVELEPFAR